MMNTNGQPSVSWQQAVRGEQKAAYVRTMFGRIAGRYDMMNHLMSLGRDQAWRRLAAGMARVPPGGLVLDLATGTGDLGLAVLELESSARVVGVDFALPMLLVGQRKRVARQTGGDAAHLLLAAADALRLPFPDDTFDAVLSAFLMRNVTDLHKGFAEQRRVVRPGGRVVCLEITMPHWPVVRLLFGWYFGHLVPQVGRWISGDPEAYTYLPESVRRFPPPATLARIMAAVGLHHVHYRELALGTIAVHVGQK